MASRTASPSQGCPWTSAAPSDRGGSAAPPVVSGVDAGIGRRDLVIGRLRTLHDPDLLRGIPRRAATKVRVLGDDLESTDLEQVAHLVAICPAHAQRLLLAAQRSAGVVELRELPRL